MSPAIKVLLIFVACVAASAMLFFYAEHIGNWFGWRPPSNVDETDFRDCGLVIFGPIAIFVIGGVVVWRSIRAQKKSAFVIALAFATFPLWFAFIALTLFQLYSR